MCERLIELADGASEPCVVAVVGRVKAGKSSFVNALLGADLAKVGATETTATINRFVYGVPDPLKPIRCVRDTGEITHETVAFLDGLQGNDEETLRRAAGIAYLEYRLPVPFLEHITLVDTPGLAAVVGEHQERAASFLGLQSELCERNAQATRRLGADADAVIYVVGEVARAGDQAFLEEFGGMAGEQDGALRAVGVLAKIDRSPDLLTRRDALCRKMETQLAGSLAAVVPVSAALQRMVDEMPPAWFAQVARLMTQTPPDLCNLLLSSDELFTTLDLPDCPVPAPDRAALLGNHPWTAFVEAANAVRQAGGDAERARTALRDTAGFAALNDLLRRRFLERGSLLRSFRIVSQASELLSDLHYRDLPPIKKRCRATTDRYTRFAAWVAGAEATDDATRRELLDLLRAEAERSGDSAARCDAVLRDATTRLDALRESLALVREDTDALEKLGDAVRTGAIAATEERELFYLFGGHGGSIGERVEGETVAGDLAAHLEKQARVWGSAAIVAANDTRRFLAERARNRYETLLDEYLSGQ